GPFRCTRRIPPCRHRAELEDTRHLYLATIAEHPGCMRRLSVRGAQPRAGGRAFNSLTPPAPKTGRKMLHRKGLVSALTTMSPAPVASGHSAISAKCPVCPKAYLPILELSPRQLFANALIAASRVAAVRFAAA